MAIGRIRMKGQGRGKMTEVGKIEQGRATTIPHRGRSTPAPAAGRRLFLQGIVAAPVLAGCGLRTIDSLTPDGAYVLEKDLPYGPGMRQRLDAYRPVELPARPLPVVVFIYGGSWRRGSKDDYRFLAEYLTRMGCAVLVADYRLFPEVRFPAFVEDGAAAVAWARANAARLGGDPTRVFVMGHSAGAHTAVLLGLEPRYLASVGMRSEDIAGVVGISGPYAVDLGTIRWLRQTFPEAARAEARPFDKARAGAPPMFLATGGRDGLVDPRNTLEFGRRLEELGNRVDTRVYASAGHADILLGFSTTLSGDLTIGGDVVRFIAA
jgi:acetyl esterase/lipase